MKRIMVLPLLSFVCSFSMEQNNEDHFKKIVQSIDDYEEMKASPYFKRTPLEDLPCNQGRVIEGKDATPYEFILNRNTIKNAPHLGKNRVGYAEGSFYVLPKCKEAVEVHDDHIKTYMNQSVKQMKWVGAALVKDAVKRGAHFDLDKYPNGQYSLALKGKLGGMGPVLANIFYYTTWVGGGIGAFLLVRQAMYTSKDILEAASKAGYAVSKLSDLGERIQSLRNTPRENLTKEEKRLLKMYKHASKEALQQIDSPVPQFATHEMVKQDIRQNPELYGFTKDNTPNPDEIIRTATNKEVDPGIALGFLPQGIYQNATGQLVDAKGRIIVEPRPNEVPYSMFSQENTIAIQNAANGFRNAASHDVGVPVIKAAATIGVGIPLAVALKVDKSVEAVVKCGEEIATNLSTRAGFDQTPADPEQVKEFQRQAAVTVATLPTEVAKDLGQVAQEAFNAAQGGSKAYFSVKKAADFMYNVGMAIPEEKLLEMCTIF